MSAAEASPRHAALPRSFHVLALACVVVSATWLAPRDARADVTMAPSQDGYLGAWLAAPLARERVDPSDLHPSAGAPLSSRLRWITWSVVDDGTGTFDLRHVFKERRLRKVVLAAVLDLSRALDGLLLISADGGVRVFADGSSVWARPAPHARGKGWDPVPLSLGAGEHVLALELEASGPVWGLDVRLLSRADLEPPAFATWRLPGASDADAEQLAAHLSRVVANVGLVPAGYQPRVRIEFPRGAPATKIALSAEPSRGKEHDAAVDLGEIRVSPAGVATVERTLRAFGERDLGASPLPTGVTVRIGSAARTVRFTLDPLAPSIFGRAIELGTALGARRVASLDPEVARATLEDMVAELGARLDSGDASAERVRQRLSAFVASYEASRDPLTVPGVLDLARRSQLDGAPDAFELHVPASYRPDAGTRYPLVVLLHGYDGTPERIMTAFLGTDSKRPFAGVNGFVVAPEAHGNAFYRGPGEAAAMDTLDWVLAHYPIDSERVSIAGHSMGGTGAAEIAFHHPDRFSAICSLAGYHSYFVRRDIIGRPLRAWEWKELVRFSPASWAENGRDMPLYVAQGTEDKPLAHSEVLVERYRALGYNVTAEWPDIGHDVWRLAWSGAKQWASLTAPRKANAPQHVTFKTDSLRSAKRGWATIVELDRPGLPALVDAKVVPPDRVAVKTSHVAAFALERPIPRLADDRTVTVSVDGTDLPFSSGESLEAHRGSAGWVRGPPERPRGPSKRTGLEGPIRDAFAGPLTFVYGTLDPRQTRAAREVAEHFRARYSGNARSEILADVGVPSSVLTTHSLFLVGSSSSNSIMRRLGAALPIAISNDGVHVGREVVRGDAELGFICVYPNPENSSLYVVAIEANDAPGLYRSMSLPLLLPDFVVFDSRVAAAAGQQVLGDATVLAAGYFDTNWSLPADTRDLIAVAAGLDPARWSPAE